MFLPRHSVPLLPRMLLLIVIRSITSHVLADNTMTDVSTNYTSVFPSTKSIYYNLTSHQQLKIEIKNTYEFPIHQTEFSSHGVPCDCYNSTCECCAGMKFGTLNLTKICVNAIVVPEQFSIQLSLQINEKVIMKHTITGKNPPPICALVPLLPLPIRLCIRVYNIRVVESIFMFCTNFEIKTDNWSVFILHFNCIEMSLLNGLSIMWVDHSDRNRPNKPLGISDYTTASQAFTNTEFVILDEVILDSENIGVEDENSTMNLVHHNKGDHIGLSEF